MEKWSPRTHFFSKSGPCLEIWSESCKLERQSVIHLIHVRKEVFSLSTAPTVPHVLVPVWSFSLTGWEVLSWDSASASRLQLKHTPGLFQGKPATAGDCFSFLVTYLGSLMLLTTFSTEPYTFVNNNCDQTSYSYSDHYSKSGPNFLGKNGPGGPFFLEFWSPGPIFSPDQNFRDRSSRDMCINWNEP